MKSKFKFERFIYAIGGCESDNNNNIISYEILDCENEKNGWKNYNLNVNDNFIPKKNFGVFCFDNNVVFVGGNRNNNNNSNNNYNTNRNIVIFKIDKNMELKKKDYKKNYLKEDVEFLNNPSFNEDEQFGYNYIALNRKLYTINKKDFEISIYN